MVTFRFNYEDGSELVFSHIVKAEYLSSGSGVNVTVEKDNLLTHHFRLRTALWLTAEDGVHSVSADKLKSISVTKE